MLTVINLRELEKLYRDRQLSKSESFDFLPERIQNFLAGIYEEKNEVPMAQLIHVHSIGGNQVVEIAREVLDDANDDILAYLPILESEQILIVSNSPEKLIQFSDVSLDDLENASLTTDEEKAFYKEIILEGASEDDSCVYAVSHAIKLEDVIAVVYSEDLEESVAAMREASEERGVLFRTTALFN